MNQLLFVHALSPLHAGTGQGAGVIDLPIAREKATNLPFLPGSSLKGVFRDQWNVHGTTDEKRKASETEQALLFGAGDTGMDHAGAINFGDARLLLLPVRSVLGTFAWITSPYLLHRFVRDAVYAGVTDLPPSPSFGKEECATTSDSALVHEGRVFVEDLHLTQARNATCDAWACSLGDLLFPQKHWRGFFRKRFCIVDDGVLDFLTETATEVAARIRLKDDTKTVERGGLWYEENLPAESILYSLGVFHAPRRDRNQKTEDGGAHLASAQDVRDALEQRVSDVGHLQFGGNATVGRGLCRVVFG